MMVFMIISRTPARLPIGGGGTDLPSYYTKYGGFFISAAINKYFYIAVNKRFEDQIKVSYFKTEIIDADKVCEIEHPIVREALKLLKIRDSIEINSISEVPSRSGMGSSGSFSVGLLNVLHAYKKQHVSDKKLAEEAFKIEAEILKEPVGKQDHYIAVFGGITAFIVDRGGNVKVRPLKLTNGTINELENNILVFYTGIQRRASDVLTAQNSSVQKNDKIVLGCLQKIKNIGMNIMDSLKSGDLDNFGELLNTHWNTKKKMSYKISNDIINNWYELGMRNGALGGKLMGAGGGGFLLFYCNKNKNRLRRVMSKEGLKECPFKFDFEGTKIMVNI